MWGKKMSNGDSRLQIQILVETDRERGVVMRQQECTGKLEQKCTKPAWHSRTTRGRIAKRRGRYNRYDTKKKITTSTMKRQGGPTEEMQDRLRQHMIK